MLVTEGKEHKILRDVLATKDGINTKITKSNEINNVLYKECPRLVPPEHNPQCVETFIELPKTQAEPSTSKKKGTKATKSKDGKKSAKLNKKVWEKKAFLLCIQTYNTKCTFLIFFYLFKFK